MKFADPWRATYRQPYDAVLFAGYQLIGQRPRQEDTFAHFNDECFIVADGVGGMPHGDVASHVACETALWAYRLVRQRPSYWSSKGLFIKRMFRSTNMRLWQKQREPGFSDGMATTMMVAIVADWNAWLGNVGDGAIFILSGGTCRKLTREDIDRQGNLTNVLGVRRLGLVPQMIKQRFVVGDTLLLATDGVTHAVNEQEIKEALAASGNTTQSLERSVKQLVERSQHNGSTDNMTAVIIKRVATERTRF